ncbi:MAG: MerR family transcriptional regulator [Roseimicrobium sp.]
MNTTPTCVTTSLVIYGAEAGTTHNLEDTADLTGLPRRTILLYSKAGLVSPAADPETEGWHFNEESLRTLRRIEQLRAAYGANLSGLKLMLELMDEVERLRAALRFLR